MVVEQGMLGVVINYWLVFEYIWFVGVDDLVVVVIWFKQYIVEYGGNFDVLFLMGILVGVNYVVIYYQ